MNNVDGYTQSPLQVFGGVVSEVNAFDVPAGSAPIACDVDYTVTSVKTRDGLANVYSYCSQSQSASIALIAANPQMFGMCLPQTLGSNIVVNGGFETGDLTGWTTQVAVGTPQVTSAQSHGGTYSVTGIGGRAEIGQVPSPASHTYYRTKIWAKSTPVTANNAPSVGFGAGSAFGMPTSPPITFDWQKIVSDGLSTIPGGTRYPLLFFGQNCFVDDVSLQTIATGYITTANSVPWSYNPTISFEFWFATSGTDGGVFLSHNVTKVAGDSFGGQTPPVWHLQIYMDTEGHIGVGTYSGVSLGFNGKDSFLNYAGATYNDGHLHQCVVTMGAGGATKIYIDGLLKQTGTLLTSAAAASNGFWRIGAGFTMTDLSGFDGCPSGTSISFFNSVPTPIAWIGGTSSFIQSCISHVSIFGSALSAAQVAAHFSSFTQGSQASYESAVTADGPTNFWYLTETTGTAAADSIGGNAGTYTGTVNLNTQLTP